MKSVVSHTHGYVVTSLPAGEQSIVTSVSVCLSVCPCLFVSELLGIVRLIFTKFSVYTLPVAVDQSSCGSIVIRYVLPVCG